MIALLATAALACGQTTHIWTALHAVDHLPDGPLKASLSTDIGRRALVSGAMFPDGGYSPLVDHPYGEAAHWEPFQDRVLAWVRDEHPGDVAAEAFLYGLAAHGLGDQLYDAMYLYRADEGQPDEATDIVIASLWGGHALNDHLVPYDALVSLFADHGVDVDVATLERGMASLDVAVLYVGRSADNPDAVAEARSAAPWATSHLEDPTVPGAPVCLGRSIAAYWQVLERRLRGEPIPHLVLESFPADGAYDHPTEGRDAMLSVVFARGMEEASVEADGMVRLDGPDGEVPIEHWLYYRQASNVLDVLPQVPLAEDATYTLTVSVGPTGIGGEGLTEPWSATFSTGPAPEVPDPPAAGCGCATGPRTAAWWLAPLSAVLSRRRRPSQRPARDGLWARTRRRRW